jgi:hypothetical protein
MPAGDRALAIVELDGRQVTVREGDSIDACVIVQIDKRQIISSVKTPFIARI